MFPGGSGDNNTVQLILQYVTDQASRAQVIKDAQETQQKIAGQGVNQPVTNQKTFYDPELLRMMDESAKKYGRTVQENIDGTKTLKKETAATSDNIRDWAKDTRLVGREYKEVGRLTREIGAEALIAGGLLSAGLTKAANDYISKTHEINTLTTAWKNSQNSISDSSMRIGKIAAETILPSYRIFAALLERAAGFLEAHPGAASGAAVTGALLIGFGTLALAVSQGIKLVSDVMYLQATLARIAASKLDQESANKILLGSENMNVAADKIAGASGGKEGVAIAGAGAIGVVAGVAASIAVMVTSSAVLFHMFDNIIQKFGATSKEAQALGQIIAIMLGPLGQAGYELNRIYGELPGVVKELTSFVNDLLGIKAPTAADTLKLSKEQQAQFTNEAVDAYARYYQTEKDMTKQHEKDIQNIKDAEADQELVAAKRNKDAVDRINSSYTTSTTNAISDFILQDKQNAEKEALARKNIIAGSSEQILKIEEGLQENLKKLAQDNAQSQYKNLLARDALGFVQQQRAYDLQKSEATSAANLQIKQTRRDLAQRLQEQGEQYALERQQRLEDFNQKQQQAAAAHTAELATQAKNYADELIGYREQEKKKLDEAEANFRDEETQRRLAFIQQLNDLYYSLNSEAKMKSDAYQQMLIQAQDFMSRYATLLDPNVILGSAIGGVSGSAYQGGGRIIAPHDYTGYAATGLYAMAQNGMPEFVLSGMATRAAERLLGGRLDEASVMSAINGGSSVTWYDHRRFDGDVGANTRRVSREESQKAIYEALKK